VLDEMNLTAQAAAVFPVDRAAPAPQIFADLTLPIEFVSPLIRSLPATARRTLRIPLPHFT
jgi:hypothetical protein